MRSEVLRKSIHLSTIIIPMGISVLPRKLMALILGIGVLIALMVEAWRFSSPAFSQFFNRYLGALLRPREYRTLSGATFLVLGAWLSLLFFQKWIAITSLWLVTVSDALAALVGSKWGRIHLFNSRTLEGSLSFILSGVIMLAITPGNRFSVGLIGIFAAFIVDGLVRHIDDNLVIPLIAGLTMEFGCRVLPF